MNKNNTIEKKTKDLEKETKNEKSIEISTESFYDMRKLKPNDNKSDKNKQKK
jgi:hypothetical protein